MEGWIQPVGLVFATCALVAARGLQKTKFQHEKETLDTGLGLFLAEDTVGLSHGGRDGDGTQGQPSLSTRISLITPQSPVCGSMNTFLEIP